MLHSVGLDIKNFKLAPLFSRSQRSSLKMQVQDLASKVIVKMESEAAVSTWANFGQGCPTEVQIQALKNIDERIQNISQRLGIKIEPGEASFLEDACIPERLAADRSTDSYTLLAYARRYRTFYYTVELLFRISWAEDIPKPQNIKELKSLAREICGILTTVASAWEGTVPRVSLQASKKIANAVLDG
jgi:hypothetical protein